MALHRVELDKSNPQASVQKLRCDTGTHSHASESPDACGSSLAEERRRAILRELWTRMAGIYPHRWTSALGVTPEEANGALRVAGDEWARALVGLTKAQITAGLDACRMSGNDWPPSSSEFRAMCLGIPSLVVVRDEIDTRTYSRFTRLVLQGGVDHNGVRWPGLDWTRYRCEPAASAMRLLEQTYKRAHDHVMRGGALPEQPVAAIEEERREFVPADPAKVAGHMATLERLLGVGRPESPGSPA